MEVIAWLASDRDLAWPGRVFVLAMARSLMPIERPASHLDQANSLPNLDRYQRYAFIIIPPDRLLIPVKLSHSGSVSSMVLWLYAG
jgi:hypothetical protein